MAPVSFFQYKRDDLFEDDGLRRTQLVKCISLQQEECDLMHFHLLNVVALRKVRERKKRSSLVSVSCILRCLCLGNHPWEGLRVR
jgi:hypothetical protein